jgi:hypothetical protein
MPPSRVHLRVVCLSVIFGLAGCASNNYSSGGTAPAITTQPANVTVNAGQTATFTVAATGTAPLSFQWQKNGAGISGATGATYITPAALNGDNGAKFAVVVSNAFGSATSTTATLTVMVSTALTTDAVTHHYDTFRSGANTHETILTTANVNSAAFGKVAEFPVDGQIDGQILFLNQVTIPNQGSKDVLYFATENDSVYAVDAASITGSTAAILWKTSALATGEAPITPSDVGCGYINPVGIMSTPVIDRSRNALYVVATSKDGSGNVFHRLHALDLGTGKELFGGPTTITANFPGTGGNSQGGIVTFLPVVQQERAALLESGGVIYTAWSGYFGDCGNYSSWVISYSADTLQQLGAIDLVPSTHGAGIWLGGGGPSADTNGNIYLTTGNAFGGNTPGIGSDFGDSVVKLSGPSPLAVADYFAPSNAILNDNQDLDFGSAAPLLLPDLLDSSQITRHLGVAAGKDGVVYVFNRDNLGQYNASKNNVYQQLPTNGHENFSSPVYFNNSVYLGPSGSPLLAFSVSQALLSTTPSSQTANSFGGGTVPSVSANGTSNGVVWALDYTSGTLYAFDASNLTKQLYNSRQAAGGRDNFATVGGHFITPMVANGRAYFGTASTVAVFGLLP